MIPKLLLAAAAAFAGLTAAGCGSTDSGQADRLTTPPTSTAATAGRPIPPDDRAARLAEKLEQKDNRKLAGSGDLAQIREVLSDVQVDLTAGQGWGVCHELTEAGQRELARLRLGGYKTCEDVVVEFSRRNRPANGKPKISRIVSVRIRGNRAIATVKDPGSGPTYRVPFTKAEGQIWKLPRLSLIEPAAAPDGA